jgi:hypothetical protein
MLVRWLFLSPHCIVLDTRRAQILASQKRPFAFGFFAHVNLTRKNDNLAALKRYLPSR